MTFQMWDRKFGDAVTPTEILLRTARDAGWCAGQAAMRERAILWSTEKLCALLVPPESWPISAKAKWPGIKVQLLLDAQSALPIE